MLTILLFLLLLEDHVRVLNRKLLYPCNALVVHPVVSV